jgi:PBP1b-binding outer membrane lipoprotein LpoB
MKKIISVLFFALIMASCSTTQCKDQPVVKKEKSEAVEQKTISGIDQMNKVKIFKADGSLQCNQGVKINLDTMAKELEGIQIFSSENKHDGLMRIQLCGKPTGNNNVYEINVTDLDKALALGFKKWTR